MTYQLLDSGQGRKLERFGAFILDRPAGAALWQPLAKAQLWQQAHARFTRDGQKEWEKRGHLPADWVVECAGMQFRIALTDFGHVGLFAEQKASWEWIYAQVEKAKRPIEVLNLFAYSGGSTLAAARAGASVCHLDASAGMVDWAKKNGEINGLGRATIRWIVDDVTKFLKRELKRGKKYDAIILDPPSFGRGPKGELFKIEEQLPELLGMCEALLSSRPLFVLLSCHTPGITPLTLRYLLQETVGRKLPFIEQGEMVIEGERPLPSGVFARCT